MTVSSQERDAMARLLQIMNGEKPTAHMQIHENHNHTHSMELPGAGVVTTQEVQAMADVLRRLNNVVDATHTQMMQESRTDHHLQEALITEETPHGVKIGVYQIQQHQDATRLAGTQYYSVVNKHTGETLAHELSLYEAAHGLVKLLNKGQFINSSSVRELLEAESAYTSQRIDAVRHHRSQKTAQRKADPMRAQLMESRKQAALDRALQAKTQVRKIYNRL